MSAHNVYILRDHVGAVLYVGVSGDVQRRIASHRRKDWWPLVESVTVSPDFPDKALAFWTERALIDALRPRFNVMTKDWLRRKRPPGERGFLTLAEMASREPA